MTRTAPRQSSETTHARRHVTCVVAHRADGLTDRLLAFGDRVEIAHDYSDREAEAEGLDCLERPHAPTMSRGDGRNDPADRLPSPQAAGMSCYSVAEEITSICADFLVELRGFEPLISAAQAAAHRRAAPRPVLQGLIAKARRRRRLFLQRYVSHQSGHRTCPGVRVAATTVARCLIVRRRSPRRLSARWTSHGSSLIWA